MEKLIAFITHNPFILIIIVGLLYSMFFRKSPIEKPPGNRPGQRPGSGPNRMPNFGGSPVFAPNPHRTDTGMPDRQPAPRPSFGGLDDPAPQPAEGPFMHVPAPATSFEAPRAPSYSLQERTEPAKPEQPRAVPARARLTPQAPAELSSVHAPTDGTRVALSADELKRAVVWAEIIGPPRAKRPYYRR